MNEEVAEKNVVAEKKKKNVMINRRIIINVIFADEVQQHLASLGQSNPCKILDRGIKIDQDCYEMVPLEYNNTAIAEYNENAIPQIEKGRFLLPSHFQNVDWTKYKESFSSFKWNTINVFKIVRN